MIGVGDEVICVDDKKPDGWSSVHFPQWVVEKEHYTIREIFENDNIVVGVLVEELRNPIIWQPLINRAQEGAFATWRFSLFKTAYEKEEEKNSKSIEIEEVTETEVFPSVEGV